MIEEEQIDSDDDAQKIEIVEGENIEGYKPLTDIKQIETQNNLTETLYESFVLPESDGFSLDFIQKNRTNDNIRRNFLSKLTYQKVWLTPL